MKGQWGWRVEGHHISIRMTVVDGAVKQPVATSPMFLGANPAVVKDGDQKGRAALHSEESAARAFLASLSGALQARAIVNAVAPGFVRTEAYAANGLSPEQVEGLFAGVAHKIPLGRVAEPEDITPWITQLAASPLVTGQVVTVDGGLDIGGES